MGYKDTSSEEWHEFEIAIEKNEVCWPNEWVANHLFKMCFVWLALGWG
jgi:hypothetical protein